MGNSHLELTKKIVLEQRNNLLAQQEKDIFQSATRLQINANRANQIGNLTVVEAVQELNQHKLTSEQLLTALALRTVTLGKQFNLFTYLYFTQALALAKTCDQERARSKKRNITLLDLQNAKSQCEKNQYLPPLFGIPISIKDVYHFQGRLATIGLISKSNKKARQSTIIQCFKNAGMIPFVQTNVAQFGMTMETGNNLWGRSLNPWNKLRSVGGSSGGQGGMIALKCSLLGLGADIGGSIRIPSEFCGVFGLKPNSRRISDTYHASLSPALQSFAKVIPNSLGPLAKSAEDLALLMLVATTSSYYNKKEDPYTKIIPFDSHEFFKALNPSKKFRIGVMKSLKDYQPTVASQRALKEVVQILTAEGHEMVEISIPDEREVIRQFIGEYMSCGGQNFREMLNGEKAVGEYNSMFWLGELNFANRCLRSVIAKLTTPRIYFYNYEKKPFSRIIDYQAHVGRICELRLKWMDYWRQNDLDFVIAPGFGCQAFPHQKSANLILACAYTYIWNTLDMASGAMPVTTVREDEEEYVSQTQDVITQEAKIVAKGSKGLPVGVQIVGLPYQEEKVLGVMSFLEKKLRFREKYPVPEPKNEK